MSFLWHWLAVLWNFFITNIIQLSIPPEGSGKRYAHTWGLIGLFKDIASSFFIVYKVLDAFWSEYIWSFYTISAFLRKLYRSAQNITIFNFSHWLPNFFRFFSKSILVDLLFLDGVNWWTFTQIILFPTFRSSLSNSNWAILIFLRANPSHSLYPLSNRDIVSWK